MSAMKMMLLFLASCLLAAACSGDGVDLSSAEREFCSLTGVSEDSADRFDLIFERGLELNLGMDKVNATAVRLRDEYESEGMSGAEAVAAVSEDLFDLDDFVTACRAAYASDGGS